jgi:hypothetical protein
MRLGLKVPPQQGLRLLRRGSPGRGLADPEQPGPGLGPHPALQAPDPAATDSFVFMALDRHQTDSAEVPRQAPDGTRPRVMRPRQSETLPGTGKPAHRPRPGLSEMQSGSAFQAAGETRTRLPMATTLAGRSPVTTITAALRLRRDQRPHRGVAVRSVHPSQSPRFLARTVVSPAARRGRSTSAGDFEICPATACIGRSRCQNWLFCAI